MEAQSNSLIAPILKEDTSWSNKAFEECVEASAMNMSSLDQTCRCLQPVVMSGTSGVRTGTRYYRPRDCLFEDACGQATVGATIG